MHNRNIYATIKLETTNYKNDTSERKKGGFGMMMFLENFYHVMISAAVSIALFAGMQQLKKMCRNFLEENK